MSFKKKPRVYEILRTPKVWEKVILCTDDFSSCRSSASSFFADDIRVIPPLVLNKLCKLQEPSLLLFYVYTLIQGVFAEIYFLEKKDVISCSTSSLRSATALALPLDRGYFAYIAFSLAHSCKPRYIPLIRHIRWTGGRNLRFNNWRRPFSCIKRGERKMRGWRGEFNT